MSKTKRIFSNNMRGGMLLELLLCIALSAIIIPFVFKYQERAVLRAKNISVANQMSNVQTALERYIMAHREELIKTVGRNIVRVNINDLAEFGLGKSIIAEHADDYQLRILKNGNSKTRATLQGIVVLSDSDITPMRTREIVNMSGGNMGFIDDKHAYGAFGAWRAPAVDFGINGGNGIVGITSVNRDNAMYLWRVPSENSYDATMQSGLNLGGHDILNAKFFDGRTVQFEETLTAGEIATDNLIFENRTSVDNDFTTQSALCSGILSSDSRSLEVSGILNIADVAKFSSFTTDNLWTSKLTLSGLSIGDTTKPAILRVGGGLDMTHGRIDAMSVSVGFSGSISPRLYVRNKIQDSINSDYYWDVSSGVARLGDLSLSELNIMAPYVFRNEGGGTVSAQIFGAVVANKNATASNYINAISEIAARVRAKYSQLQLR